MTNEEWAKELKQNTQVMRKTFTENELNLMNFGYVIDGSSLHCYVEVSSADEDFDVEDFEIKLNLYDSDGDICAVHGESSYEFTGYDTFDIWISGFSKIQSTVASARLYVKKQ